MHVSAEEFKKKHFFSETDARLKLLVSASLIIMILSYKGVAFPLVVVALGLLFCIHMRVPVRVFILRFSEPAFIALVLILMKFFFSGSDALFTFHFFGLTLSGYKDGLVDGLMIATRILGAVSVIVALGFATPFTEVISGLSWFRLPKGLIEIVVFAYRYIFMLLEDATVIYNAQKNRLGYTNIRCGMNSFGVLAGSLILKAFEHSQNATVAMVQRGYDGTIPLLRHKPFKPSEIAISLLFVVVMGIVWKIG